MKLARFCCLLAHVVARVEVIERAGRQGEQKKEDDESLEQLEVMLTAMPSLSRPNIFFLLPSQGCLCCRKRGSCRDLAEVRMHLTPGLRYPRLREVGVG